MAGLIILLGLVAAIMLFRLAMEKRKQAVVLHKSAESVFRCGNIRRSEID